MRYYLTIILSVFISGNLFSQSLRVSSVRKISDKSGGLGPVLGTNDHFGYRARNIGDINGDGIDDLAVTDAGDDDGGTDNGAVYILFMKSDATVKSKQKISSGSGNFSFAFPSSGYELFGLSVAPIGDLDKDGVPDIAVGAIGDNSYAGSVFLLYLNNDGTVKSYKKFDSNTSGLSGYLSSGWFGYDVANIGDVDGNGIPDLAVGALEDDNAKGAAYILFLDSASGLKKVTRIADGSSKMPSLTYNDRFGVSLAPLGDINKDGIPDIIVGAHGDGESGMDAGAAYILRLKSDGNIRDIIKLNGKTTNHVTSDTSVYFGCCVSPMPDVNGDSVQDLLIGSFYTNDNGSQKGAFYILCLDSASNLKSYQKFSDNATGIHGMLHNFDRFGCGASFLSADSTGYKIAIGASLDDDGNTDAGAVYIISLSPSGSVASDLALGYHLIDDATGYPNPFSENSTISYRLTRDNQVSIQITDISGKTVYSNTETQSAGSHSIQLNTAYNKGIYFARIAAGGDAAVVKMMKE
jgi:hypothetical protein